MVPSTIWNNIILLTIFLQVVSSLPTSHGFTTTATTTTTTTTAQRPQYRRQVARFLAHNTKKQHDTTPTPPPQTTPTTTIPWQTQTSKSCWRPTVSDVERISWGQPARQKRTGSRGVPHRLNREERTAWDQARRKGWLEVRGSAWRGQRRDAPLLNTYRSYCDAQQHVSLVLHKQASGRDDQVVLDLSPLRVPESFDRVSRECLALFPGGEIDAGALRQTLLLLTNNDDNDGNEPENPNEMEEKEEEERAMVVDLEDYLTRPIYQVAPYCLVWELPRAEAKTLAQRLALEFGTQETKSSSFKSKKPLHVKPGKSRRHGGYGIG